MKNLINLKNSMLTLLLMMVASVSLLASSHREAPLISNDPLADNVDVYAFRSPDNPDMITLIATYVPMQLPHGGPNYYSFGENIRYEIHVDNDASIPGDEVTYRFTFNKVNEDPSTFFNIRLGAENQKTTYTLQRSLDGGVTWQTIVTDGVVPPNNIGPRSIESAVGLNTTYKSLFEGAITDATTGEKVFAGPTDDPFFVDLGGIFDLGDAPRQNGKAVDGLACYNVSALAIQVPISTLLKAGAPAEPSSILDSDYVIGVWASASRPAITTLSATGNPTYAGDWVQVSRLGMPLTNEAVIAIGDKDYWNSITPYEELAETTMDDYFYNPELALYMDDDLFGGAVPGFAPLRIQKSSLGAFDFTNGADGLFGLKGSDAVAGTALDDAIFGTLLLPGPGQPRSVDLWPAFHTGVPNFPPYQLATGKAGNPLAAGKPFVNNFLPNGGDMLRLNMAVPPTPRDDANFSSLGLIQAAAIGLTVAPFNETAELEFIPNMDGFPNGRRLEDDVTRIELQAVAGVVLAAVGLWYDDFNPEADASPVTQGLLNVLSYTTGVEENDRPFSGSFPYLAMPFSGTGNCSGEVQPLTGEGTDIASQIFVSSNTTGQIGIYEILENNDLIKSSFLAQGSDADGIYYDEPNDVLYQLNRSENVINAYSNVAQSIAQGMPLELTATSTSDFSNGREIAFAGNQLVVAQDANSANNNQNRLLVYDASATSITLSASYDVDFNLWGIVYEGTTLFAIEDNSNRLAIFENFLTETPGSITPSSVVEIEGIVRTHGITYLGESDKMLLTDVGAASSPDDGAIVTVDNFMTASADGMISTDEQLRIAGPATFLGNPVDIAWEANTMTIFVAERANGGGRVLGFEATASGDAAPIYNESFGGAAGIFINASNPAMLSGADISLTATVDNALYAQYEEVVYSITVTNNGPEATSNVSVAAGLPNGMVFTSSNVTVGAYDLFFERWDIGTLAVGESATLDLTLFTLIGGEDITNYFQVLTSSTDDPDSTPGNDTDMTADEDDEAAVTITPIEDGGEGNGDGMADLALNISVDADEVVQWTNVTYTFSLTNNGPDATSNIIVDIPQIEALAFTSASAVQGDFNLFFEEWTIDELASGATAELTLVLFNKVVNQTVNLYAEVRTSAQPDPDSTPGNGDGMNANEDDEAVASFEAIAFVFNAFANDSGSATFSIAPNDKGIAIYPNPVGADLNVEFILENTKLDQVTVYDVNGRILIAQNFAPAMGFNKVRINTQELAEGMYFVQTPGLNGEATLTKFVKKNL